MIIRKTADPLIRSTRMDRCKDFCGGWLVELIVILYEMLLINRIKISKKRNVLAE